MGRRAERLVEGEETGDVIAVVARAFDIMRCFGENGERLANSEVAERCKLPRSTVSRLTHTLTRMGQLVYFPRDGKYRVGPSAIAQSATVLRNAPARNWVRDTIGELARDIPGTIGLTCADGPDMVYLEYARAYHAIALNSVVGTRVSLARTAAGQAYAAALSPPEFVALAKQIARHDPADSRVLLDRVDANRRALKRNGFVLSAGLWHPHIAGVGVPVWSEVHGTWFVLVCGVLAKTYGPERLRREVAPRLLDCAATIARFDLEFTPGEAALRERRPQDNKRNIKERTHELGAGTRRTRAPQVAHRTDGRRGARQAPA